MSRTILTSIVLTFAFLEFGLAQYPFREVGVGPTGTDQIDPSVAVNAYDERIVIASWSDTREPGLHPAQTKLYVASSVDAGATWTNRKLPESQQYTHGANPRVAVGTNIAYVCFTRIGNAGIEDGIFVASSTNLETWTYTQVSPDLGLQYEPTVAVNTISGNTYQDRVYVTWRDWDYARILVRYSDDFGITWSTPYVIAEISNPSADPVRTLPGIEASDSISTETPPDGNMAFHPSIAIGPDGNVYIAWWESVPEKYRLRKSTDGGQSFSPATDIVSAPFVFYRTANDMMIETNRPSFVIAPNGDLLFAFTSPNHVGPFIFYYPRFYRSQNNGASFSESVLPVPSEEVLIYPRISFSESNGVVVTYIYQQVSVIDGMASMWTTASPDNGSTFAPAQRGSAQYSTHADYGYLQ